MNYLSVCSGIEAASVAWKPLGWKAVGFSEIEPFCCELLKQRFPDVKNYGDMANYKEWNIDEEINLLVGGTPCQSFSLAGLREGLNDDRGNLALTFCNIAAAYRPRWIVWENVPGVLSSDRGRDFGTLLGALASIGYGFAYRVLNAQFWGVAQRRRRVFVIGHLGDWRPPAGVLFDTESLRRNPKKGKTKKRRTSKSAKRLLAKSKQTGTSYGAIHNISGVEIYDELAPTLRKSQRTFAIAGNIINRDTKQGGNGAGFSEDISYTLTRGDVHAVAYGINGMRIHRKDHHPRLPEIAKEKMFTLVSQKVHAVVNSLDYMVRYLTPIEYERLQGFPDNWTQIKWGSREVEDCPKTPRYEAIGNSMAVPVMNWLGRRIELIEELMKETKNELN